MHDDPFLGQIIGKYEVVEKIGQGGMGVVYKGRQMSLNRSVAIKVLPKQMAIDREFVQRFLQEAEVIARLVHDNIVYVFDIDQFEGAYYIVMEYVDGHSLREYRGQPLPADQVQAIGVPVARALDYAHQRGIVHRDVKSSNVMVTRERKVKLMDFGIAKSVGGGGVKTVTGSVLGTPEYMAPEQARGGAVTIQSDVYALGVLLYELAVGELPFAAEDPFAMALKHISEQPVPPSQRQPSVPQWLDRVILRAMAKELGDRYPTAAALEEDLRAGGGGIATPAFSPVATGIAPPAVQITATAPASPVTPTPSSGFAPPAVPQQLVTPTPPRGPAMPPPPPGYAGAPVGSVSPPAVPPSAGVALPTPTPTFAEAAAHAAPPMAPTMAGPAGQTFAEPAPVRAKSRGPLLLALAAVAAGLLVVVIVVGLWLLGRAKTPTTDPSEAQAASAGVPTPASPNLRQQGEGQGAGTVELDAAQRQRLSNKLLLDKAEQELRAGNREEALRLIDQVLATDPTNERALALRQQAQARPSAPPPAPPPPRQITAVPPPAPPPPTTAPGIVSTASIGQLWAEAETLHDREHYHSLAAKLDELLALDPRHEKANRWRSNVGDWIRDQESDVRDELDSYLEDFMDYIDGQDVDDIGELWNEQLDTRTASYFRKLFDKYPVVRASYTLGDVKVWDNAASFTAYVDIRAKPRRGPMVEYQPVSSNTWNGRFDLNGEPRFTSSFP